MQTILVIDDEANMRHMLTALLGKSGYAVTTAADGSEGLRLAGERRFDFILCDLKMPVMDGLAFLAGMRAADLGGTVIMMSAYGTVDQAIETVQQGAYDYISKPFKLDEILLVLRKAEERERLRDENRQLRHRLSFAKNHFWKSLTNRAMMIQFSKSQVLIRKLTAHRQHFFQGHVSLTKRLQCFFQILLLLHVPSPISR